LDATIRETIKKYNQWGMRKTGKGGGTREGKELMGCGRSIKGKVYIHGGGI